MSLSWRVTCENMSASAKRAYPTGRKRLLSEEFKERVRKRLSELEHDHRWLEEQIGASRGMVTKMLKPQQNTSGRALPVPSPTADPAARRRGVRPARAAGRDVVARRVKADYDGHLAFLDSELRDALTTARQIIDALKPR